MFKSSQNLRDTQRKVRMSLGIILLVLVLFELTGLIRAVVIILATYWMVTGIVAYCPISEMLETKKHRRR